jgi:hypothetical protein
MLHEANRTSASLTPADVAAAAESALGRPVVIDDAALACALDARTAIEARRCVGAASEASMSSMLAGFVAQLSWATSWTQAVAASASRARTDLVAGIRNVLAEA